MVANEGEVVVEETEARAVAIAMTAGEAAAMMVEQAIATNGAAQTAKVIAITSDLPQLVHEGPIHMLGQGQGRSLLLPSPSGAGGG